MNIQNVLLIVLMVVVMIREYMVQKQFKQHRMTISTLLFIISEDPEKFEKVMQDIYNINGFEEVD